MATNVLVVGGAGYAGGLIVDLLEKEPEYRVRVLDNLTYEDMFRKPVDFHFVDISNGFALEPHLDWSDVVVWLAAIVGDGACEVDPLRTRRVNVDAVRMLKASFGGRIIFFSTCSVYGAQDGLLAEDSPTNPLSLYAETKLEAENILLEAENEILVFRLGTLFGLADYFARFRTDLVLNLLTAHAVLHGSMKVFGGRQFRPLLHVRDAARAVVREIASSSSGIFNLVGENLSIIQLAEKIRSVVPDSTVVFSESDSRDERNYSVSGEKAASELGFKAKLSIDFGVREVKSFIESGRLSNFENSRFSNVAALTRDKSNAS